MIRINLLPFRAARKIENIRRQITIYVLLVVLTIISIGYVFIQINGELTALKQEKNIVDAELKTYQKTLNEIKLLEKQIKEIKTKLGVIKTLEKGKAGPVLLLEAISNAVPKDKLWLNSFSESNGKIALSGTAMDNETVALFMDNLKNTGQIQTVELRGTQLRDIPQYKLKVSDFSLDCTQMPATEKKK